MRRIEKLNSDEFFNIYVKSKSNLLKLENSNESVMILFREGIKVEINGIFHSRGALRLVSFSVHFKDNLKSYNFSFFRMS